LRRRLSLAATAAGIFLLTATQSGCGGGGSGAPSGLDQRVFVSIQNPGVNSQGFAGAPLEIIDGSKDQVSSSTVTLAASSPAPAIMIPGANNTTIVYDASDNDIAVIDNNKEALVTTETTGCTATSGCIPTLPAATQSIAASTDGKFVYAALRTISQVSIVALTAGPPITVTNIPTTPSNCAANNNCLPGAHRIVLSHNNAKLLVFNEDLNQLEVVNTADNSTKTISGTGLDHPSYGVFSSDDSKAYILNCGAECGGTQASVSVLDMTALTIGQTVTVDAATIGTADSTNLYVAGSNPATPAAGSATILPLSGLTGGKQVKIGDGFHQVMTLFQNKLMIGARTCTTGCLSLVDPSGATAIVDPPKGDVAAVTGIPTRTVFYAAEGGELRIYDVSNLNEHLTNGVPVINIVGKVTGVLYVGPKTQ